MCKIRPLLGIEVASSLSVATVNWKGSTSLALGLAIWLTAVVAGMGILRGYSVIPGIAGTPPADWPIASHISPPPGYFTLVMTIHSHCPCSRASIGELSVLMAHSGGRMAAFVVFVTPPGFDENWTKTDLWSSAGLIPGVTRIIDGGTEANLFGAATSGQTMVYDRRGRLLFSGGITAARGHFGDNAGVSAIVAFLDTPSSAGLAKTAVYGCPLFAPSANHKNELGKCSK
jgi:hypothetical protein